VVIDVLGHVETIPGSSWISRATLLEDSKLNDQFLNELAHKVTADGGAQPPGVG
jgi:hypothetical protein